MKKTFLTKTATRAAFAAVLVLSFVGSGCEVERRPAGGPAPGPPPSASNAAAETNYGMRLDGVELAEGEADTSRNFYFIFDGSGSMKAAPESPCETGRFDSKMQGAYWALNTFLEKVPEDVHMGLYVFDQRGEREVVPLAGGNRDAFVDAINHIVPGGGTPLADALRFGTQKLVEQYKAQLGYGEYRLVVVTDGKANGIPEAAHFANEWGMPIYAIGLCIDEDHPLRQFALSYRAADSFEDLEAGLAETLAELPTFDTTEFDATQVEAEAAEGN